MNGVVLEEEVLNLEVTHVWSEAQYILYCIVLYFVCAYVTVVIFKNTLSLIYEILLFLFLFILYLNIYFIYFSKCIIYSYITIYHYHNKIT